MPRSRTEPWRAVALCSPNWLQLRKFFARILSSDEAQPDQGQDTLTDSPTVGGIMHVGDSFAGRHDPDHLPPTTFMQKLGHAISAAWHVVGCEESIQGLRAACAVMCVAIINFLEPTQQFFIQHRIVWAETIIILGMATSPGANVFGLVARVVGTTIGMVVSLVSWYIPNQNAPGVIVIQFVFNVDRICRHVYQSRAGAGRDVLAWSPRS